MHFINLHLAFQALEIDMGQMPNIQCPLTGAVVSSPVFRLAGAGAEQHASTAHQSISRSRVYCTRKLKVECW